jgi:hypothetical protein
MAGGSSVAKATRTTKIIALELGVLATGVTLAGYALLGVATNVGLAVSISRSLS